MRLTKPLWPLLLCLPAIAAADDWYPSRYGADDTLGAYTLKRVK